MPYGHGGSSLQVRGIRRQSGVRHRTSAKSHASPVRLPSTDSLKTGCSRQPHRTSSLRCAPTLSCLLRSFLFTDLGVVSTTPTYHFILLRKKSSLGHLQWQARTRFGQPRSAQKRLNSHQTCGLCNNSVSSRTGCSIHYTHLSLHSVEKQSFIRPFAMAG